MKEDESATNAKDARTLLAKFNEQIEPLYVLLRDCEDVRLAPELLDPEPVNMKSSQKYVFYSTVNLVLYIHIRYFVLSP